MEVVLIGKGPGFEKAPRKNESVITWGVNDVCGHRECDVIFWLDRQWLKGSQVDSVIKESVNLTKTPMYSTQVWTDIPTSIRYPKEQVIDFFGIDYFADSCAWMIALAIMQGFNTITMYGFNYAWGSNYVHEKPCVEFWLGVALARGITLNIQGEVSDLLTSKPSQCYAFRDEEKVPRTNLKMNAYEVKLESKKFSFNVKDRVALIQLLPKQGNYEMLKASQTLHKNLWFRDSEQRLINLRQVEDDSKRPFFIWDDADIDDIEVELTPQAQHMVRSILNKINSQNALTQEMYNLYEKFCL